MAAPSDDMLRSDGPVEQMNFPGDFSGATEPNPDTGTSQRGMAMPHVRNELSFAEEYAVKNEVVREKGDRLSRNIRGTICLIIAIAVFL